MQTRLLVLTLFAAVLLTGCASAPPPDPNAFPNEHWSTTHRPQGALMWTSSRFNSVTLRPDAGSVLVTFDPNTCTLDRFGDAGACTMMTTVMLNTEPQLVDTRRTRDGSTERLFSLTAEAGPRIGVVFKTPPGADSPSHARLIATNHDGGIDTIINLHRAQSGPPAETPPEPTGLITNRWHTGYRPQRSLFSDRNINSARIIPDGPGRCRFILDPNSCTLDAFGTITACTRMSTQLVMSSYQRTEMRTLDNGSVQERFEFTPDLGAIIPVVMIRATHPDGRVTAKLLFYSTDGQIDATIILNPGRGEK